MSLLSPQLEAFVAITQHKTVHAAAHAIHITQTAVTQRIHGLETKLKTTLFIRTRRGMALTAEGEALLRYCQAAKNLEGETLAKIQRAGVESDIQISISASSSLTQSRIMPECFPILKKFPHLLMHFDVNDQENRHLTLKAGECDFAVIQPEHIAQEMQVKNLKPEQYVLVCSAAWQGRKLTEIIQSERIIDFDPSDQMTFNYLKHFDLFSLLQSKKSSIAHGRHFTNRTVSVAMMVAAGFGYTTLTKEFAKPYLDEGTLITLNGGKIYNNPLVLAWYHRPEPPKYFTAILEAIK